MAHSTSLQSLWVGDTTVIPTTLHSLAQLPNLEHLQISSAFLRNDTFSAWVGASSMCRRLKSLSLGVEGDQLLYPSKNCLNILLGKMPNLERLRLDMPELGDYQLRVIACYCPLLRELRLGTSFQYTSKIVQSLIYQCPRLKWLEIPYEEHYGKELWAGRYRKLNVVSIKSSVKFGWRSEESEIFELDRDSI